MSKTEIDTLDLAALLCSRICHDVISPVGAILNGFEVLDDDKDGSMRDFALGLIRKSAGQAAARLKFARLAFGAAEAAGRSIDLGDAQAVAMDFINDERTQLSWTGPRLLLEKNRVKLLLNLVMVATSAIPRGGRIAVAVEVEGDSCRFDIRATGQASRIPPNLVELLAGAIGHGGIDARAVQPYYTGAIARAAGMAVGIAPAGDDILIEARSVAARAASATAA
jgi:histidine phosphotransferase ChpT